MFGTESQIDAEFFRMIHRSVTAARSEADANRRSSDRHRLFADHQIAAVRSPGFPPDSAFIPVCCHDLSRSGFSFFLPNRPDFTSLVAAFGCGQETLYVGAEVVHCQDVLIHHLGEIEFLGRARGRTNSSSRTTDLATPMTLVGCRFTERLEKPAAGR